MSCPFSLDHYDELLAAARAGGYRFATFDAPPEDGALLLRHDVDLCLDAALAVAEREAGAGATATYFLMTRSLFYNLDSPEGEAAIARLRALGHRVGQHAVWPAVDDDPRFDPVLAWHNPDEAYMRAPVDGHANVMEVRWSGKLGVTYQSDSNAHWRRGCPHEPLRAGALPWLQLLTHPAIWAYPGATMGAKMRAMADAHRDRELARVAGDRIDLA